jgi:hypothetical protein
MVSLDTAFPQEWACWLLDFTEEDRTVLAFVRP